ncbi:MAG TPA: hypothetical protein GXZ23_02665 [Clostridiales bacterium]|nr:hypothetical protein [Clostridiales bacterium]
MAKCPKCKKELRWYHWKQHCPFCDANVFVYDLQERLMQDADKAEVQYYHFQKKIDRIKYSFVGSKLAIVRIFTNIFPIAALCLPLAKCKFFAPFEPIELDVSLITVIQNADKLSLTPFLNLPKCTDSTLFLFSVIFLLLSILATFVHFILNTLACSPKGNIRNYIQDVFILIFTVGSIVCFGIMGENSVVIGTLSIGAYVYLGTQILNVVIDVMTQKQNIEVKHKQCYVGGIPIEEYFEMVESEMKPEDIRQEQYRRLTEIQLQQEAELKKKREKEAKLNVG